MPDPILDPGTTSQPSPNPDPTTYPPYLHGSPCRLCHCTGYTPCGVPPDHCGSVALCPQCRHNAQVIAQLRLQINMIAAMLPDDQVRDRAAAWGIPIPA